MVGVVTEQQQLTQVDLFGFDRLLKRFECLVIANALLLQLVEDDLVCLLDPYRFVVL